MLRLDEDEESGEGIDAIFIDGIRMHFLTPMIWYGHDIPNVSARTNVFFSAPLYSL